jgi:hypothetical protein
LVGRSVGQLVGQLVGWLVSQSIGWSAAAIIALPPHFRCAAATADAALPPSWLPPPPNWLQPPPSWLLPLRCSWDNYFVCVFLFWQVIQSLVCK